MYCTQAAVIGMTKALAMEVGEYSVLVNFVRSKIRNMKNEKKGAPFLGRFLCSIFQFNDKKRSKEGVFPEKMISIKKIMSRIVGDNVI